MTASNEDVIANILVDGCLIYALEIPIEVTVNAGVLNCISTLLAYLRKFIRSDTIRMILTACVSYFTSLRLNKLL